MLEQRLLIFKVSNNNDLSLTAYVWTEIIHKSEYLRETVYIDDLYLIHFILNL
jgi:hypothetical protein